MRLGEFRLDRIDLSFKLVEAIALRQADGGGFRGLGADDQPIPAPQIAFLGDEARTDRQLRLQAVAIALGHDADGR